MSIIFLCLTHATFSIQEMFGSLHLELFYKNMYILQRADYFHTYKVMCMSFYRV